MATWILQIFWISMCIQLQANHFLSSFPILEEFQTTRILFLFISPLNDEFSTFFYPLKYCWYIYNKSIPPRWKWFQILKNHPFFVVCLIVAKCIHIAWSWYSGLQFVDRPIRISYLASLRGRLKWINRWFFGLLSFFFFIFCLTFSSFNVVQFSFFSFSPFPISFVFFFC